MRRALSTSISCSIRRSSERSQRGQSSKQARIQQRKILLDLEVARNRLLPQLNVAGDVGTVGQDADYGRALGQVGERTAWQWRIGADLSWAPLGLEARANIRRIESSLRQAGRSREAALLDVRAQLRMALRNIDTAERRLYAAARARDLSERSWKSSSAASSMACRATSTSHSVRPMWRRRDRTN